MTDIQKINDDVNVLACSSITDSSLKKKKTSFVLIIHGPPTAALSEEGRGGPGLINELI